MSTATILHILIVDTIIIVHEIIAVIAGVQLYTLIVDTIIIVHKIVARGHY